MNTLAGKLNGTGLGHEVNEGLDACAAAFCLEYSFKYCCFITCSSRSYTRTPHGGETQGTAIPPWVKFWIKRFPMFMKYWQNLSSQNQTGTTADISLQA